MTSTKARAGFDYLAEVIRSFRNGDLRDPNLEEYLTMSAEQIIAKAYESKDPGNRTFNQHDAYYWALYFHDQKIGQYIMSPTMAMIESGMDMDEDGNIVPYGSDKNHYFGSEEAQKAIDKYVPNSEAWYTLLIGNAMYYSVIQERGLKYSRDKDETRYQVLSQTYGAIQELAERYNGRVLLINMTS